MLVAYVGDEDRTRIACMPRAGRHATHRSAGISNCSGPQPKSSTAPLQSGKQQWV
jgi:hypothetical protein